MRIKVTHHTIKTGGLFSTTLYEVHARVDFTHEERQIIRQRGLTKTKILDRRPADAREDDPDHWYELTVQNLIDRKPDKFRCATPSEAKVYEEDLIDALRMVKAWIDDNADPGAGRVIEL